MVSGYISNPKPFRETSHPNLVQLEPIPDQTDSKCASVCTLHSIASLPSKSIIWISAKDLGKYPSQILCGSIFQCGKIADNYMV